MIILWFIIIILFILAMIIFTIGGVGEQNKELRRNYVFASCVFAALTVMMFMIGGKLWN